MCPRRVSIAQESKSSELAVFRSARREQFAQNCTYG